MAARRLKKLGAKPKANMAAMVAAAKARKRRAKRNPSLGGLLENPIVDTLKGMVPGHLVATLGPAVVTYAGTRILAPLVANKLSSVPFIGKFMGPISSTAFGGAFYWLAGKIKRDYQESALIGAGIAVVQSIVEAIAPALVWLTGAAASPWAQIPVSATAAAPTGDTQYMLHGIQAVQADSGPPNPPSIRDFTMGDDADLLKDPADEMLQQGIFGRK